MGSWMEKEPSAVQHRAQHVPSFTVTAPHSVNVKEEHWVYGLRDYISWNTGNLMMTVQILRSPIVD